MPYPLSSVIASRLEKAAVDNGFDRELPALGEWLAFASTQCPLCLWLWMTVDGAFAIALSQHNVAVALETPSEPFGELLPTGAVEARIVPDIPTLHHLIRRAFQLSKSLPDELLHVFVARTAALPRTTEAERLVIQRVGQDIFRQGLLNYWEGRCAITGLAVPELLRASHVTGLPHPGQNLPPSGTALWHSPHLIRKPAYPHIRLQQRQSQRRTSSHVNGLDGIHGDGTEPLRGQAPGDSDEDHQEVLRCFAPEQLSSFPGSLASPSVHACLSWNKYGDA